MDRQIYFAECQGRIKVGIANNVKARLSQLRTGAGAPVKLLATIKGSLPVERALHKKLRPFHIDGEWYQDCADTRAAIQNSVNNFPLGVPVDDPKCARTNFRAVAKVLWPFKTAAHLAAIARVDERTANRWLSGEHEPPVCIVIAVVEKTFGRHSA